MKHTVSLEQC